MKFKCILFQKKNLFYILASAAGSAMTTIYALIPSFMPLY